MFGRKKQNNKKDIFDKEIYPGILTHLHNQNQNVSKHKVLIEAEEFQTMILKYIESEEFNKHFAHTKFCELACSNECKQAMMHGMAIASLMTSRCHKLVIKENILGDII